MIAGGLRFDPWCGHFSTLTNGCCLWVDHPSHIVDTFEGMHCRLVGKDLHRFKAWTTYLTMVKVSSLSWRKWVIRATSIGKLTIGQYHAHRVESNQVEGSNLSVELGWNHSQCKRSSSHRDGTCRSRVNSELPRTQKVYLKSWNVPYKVASSWTDIPGKKSLRFWTFFFARW